MLEQRLSTDKKTGHLMLTPSPTCMKEIGETTCGHCVYLMSGDEIFVGEKKENWLNGKPWSQLNRESVLLPAEESYAPLAAYIINSCEKMNCNDQVTRFKVKLDSLNGVRGAIKN
ncbi:MAG: hypothetical protein EON58_17485 [Alphaproteobacteria bacterium]|nr:MAG: hypothetical protein EON58_17485 [Alphaproteobacteria bacterium]